MSGPLEIDWASAEVDGDGRLRVGLTGDVDKQWRTGFGRVANRLGREGRGGAWDAVRFKRGAIEVTGVQDGSEEPLRHFLESVVRQANADAASPTADDASDDEQNLQGEEKDVAQELTERFRRFGAPES